MQAAFPKQYFSHAVSSGQRILFFTAVLLAAAVEISPVWYPAPAEVEAIYVGIKRSVTLNILPQ